MSNQVLEQWLLHSALFGTVILAIGAIAVCLIREPIYRIAVIRWTFVACLLIPAAQQMKLLPSVSLTWTIPGSATTAQSNPPSASHQNPISRTVQAERFAEEPQISEDAYPAQQSPAWEATQVPAASVVSDFHSQQQAKNSNRFGWSLLPSLAFACQVIYGVAVSMLAVFWGLGLYRRSRIANQSAEAPEQVINVLSEIAPEHAARTRLLVSERISSPIMWGWIRPTIVIPSELAGAENESALRWGLAHECSHVAHHDFASHLVSSFLKLTCFYQPLYWWLRKQLNACQDYVADAFAAEQGNNSEDYAEFLVQLASKQNSNLTSVSLGISDRPSELSRRVRMLIESATPLRQSCNRSVAVLIAVTISSFAIALGTLNVSFANEDAPSEKPEQTAASNNDDAKQETEPKKSDEEKLPNPITYKCRVIDRETKEGIAGVRVEVTLEHTAKPTDARHSKLGEIVVETDADGYYQFTLKPEHVKIPSLYIVVNAHHQDYQSKGRSGYSHSMIRTNLKNGEPPFYETIRLSSGEAIFGRLVTPEGKPSAGSEVLVYSKRAHNEEDNFRVRGSFQETKTDEKGYFRLTIATPGDGVLWLRPSDFSPLAIRLRDRRGDFGDITLSEGTRVTGQLYDAKGNELAGLYLSARRRGDGEDADEFLGANAVANGIRGTTTSTEDGNFEFPPLPPGEYSVEVSLPRDDAQGVLEHVFTRSQLTIPDNGKLDPIEIRALPHVIVRGRFFDGEGKPRASHDQHLFAQFRGESYFTQSTKPGKDGWFEFMVPHGAENVQVSLITNEHSSLRWRTKPDEKYTYGHRAMLGTLEEDFTTLEVIRYRAPMLLLKAVDENGKQITGFKPRSKYKTRSQTERMGTFISGALGDIGFEEQPDGRWRSSQMLPDDEVTISIEIEGYESEPQVVDMKEGENRELVFVLKPSV